MIEIHVLGNLTKDPEGSVINTVNGQTQKAKFSVAANRYKGKERLTVFVSCTAFGKQAETILRYARKGDKIYVEGVPEVWVSSEGKGYLQMDVNNYEFAGGNPAHESVSSAAPVRSSVSLPDEAVDVTETFLKTGSVKPPEPQEVKDVPLPWNNDNDLPF